MMNNNYGYITEYYNKIGNGEIVAPKMVIKIYKKIINLLNSQPDKYYYDNKAAELIIRFSETYCRQSKDVYAGELIKLLLWQKAMLSVVYGFKRVENGHRVIHKVVLEVGKKNGKSTILCCPVLFTMLKKGQSIYCAANGLEQASIIYGEVNNMLEQSPELKLRIKNQSRVMKSKQFNNFSQFKPLPKKKNTANDGLLSTMIILDEFWGMSIDEMTILENSQATVQQPLLFMISTAGTVREGAFDETICYCKQVVNGTVDNDSVFPLLYTFDDPDEIKDKRMWAKPNPSLGSIMTVERLNEKYMEATAKPRTLAEFKTKFFNVITSNQIDNYFDYDKFKNMREIDMEIFKGGYCIGGVDLSRNNDLTSVTTMRVVNDELFVKNHYFITKDCYNRRLNDTKLGSSYRYWVENGYMTIAGDEVTDYRAVVEYFESMSEQGIIYRYIGYDNYSSANFVNHMNDVGFRAKKCLIPVIQGYRTLSLPFQFLEAKLHNRKVVYDDPVTEWCISNVCCEQDRNGNYLPSKRNNDMKIDGFATILNCCVMYCENGKDFD